MVPSDYTPLFAAAAGVAGALIGLLFVAVSIEHERLTAEDAEQVHRVRASAALTAFTNALVVSLFALVPGAGLRWTPLAVSLTGLLFVVAALLSLWRVRNEQDFAWREPVFLIGLVVTFLFQLRYALEIVANDHDTGAIRGVAVMVIVCFVIGIARSWELIGGPEIGVGREIAALLRRRSD